MRWLDVWTGRNENCRGSVLWKSRRVRLAEPWRKLGLLFKDSLFKSFSIFSGQRWTRSTVEQRTLLRFCFVGNKRAWLWAQSSTIVAGCEAHMSYTVKVSEVEVDEFELSFVVVVVRTRYPSELQFCKLQWQTSWIVATKGSMGEWSLRQGA